MPKHPSSTASGPNPPRPPHPPQAVTPLHSVPRIFDHSPEGKARKNLIQRKRSSPALTCQEFRKDKANQPLTFSLIFMHTSEKLLSISLLVMRSTSIP